VPGGLDAPGALHHVMIRGIERRAIFRGGLDRRWFVERLAALTAETATSVFAWALLPNHVHLLLRSGRGGLSNFMQRLVGAQFGTTVGRARRVYREKS
jgi:REP element-mobilizing transposase RayT